MRAKDVSGLPKRSLVLVHSVCNAGLRAFLGLRWTWVCDLIHALSTEGHSAHSVIVFCVWKYVRVYCRVASARTPYLTSSISLRPT